MDFRKEWAARFDATDEHGGAVQIDLFVRQQQLLLDGRKQWFNTGTEWYYLGSELLSPQADGTFTALDSGKVYRRG